MTEATVFSKHQSRKPRRPKRPPLTHFLCFPLVNTASIPQLESSLATFKTAHLLRPGLTPQQTSKEHADTSRLCLPGKAFRPLGTLHLTLGVMSLPSKERLNQAIAFFQSLDLAAMIREVEQVSTPAQEENASHQPSPFTISLESLHALPRPKSATVLHASPIDPTGRLLPFCVKLRDKFIEAGFIQNEPETKPGSQNSYNALTQGNPSFSESSALPGNSAFRPEEQQILPETSGLTENPSPSIVPQARKPKPRPLLLHATLVNTIYVRGRHNIQNSQGKDPSGNSPSKRMTFDARSLVSQYRHYYSDDNRTVLHTLPIGSSADIKTDRRIASQSNSGEGTTEESIEQLNPENHENLAVPSLPPSPTYPFIWAKEIPLDTISICEMGARKLHPGVNDGHGLNERLGEQYTVVAERSLLPI
ncbi:hypothetical protein N7457_007873 [Penicillium paradoxum]|uniref:uncharacterized protein n=1 Tax=Penicillium paradoxum TaxID=176176 RepID=UPI0025470C23|nr:uncharacterized protein N7457_007873 [Penicillium paradoxum]KAJ5772977.1 hypothetical protein N7457_007873 [Penicillium paradoxum]